MKYLFIIIAFLLAAAGSVFILSKASVPAGGIMLLGSIYCVYRSVQAKGCTDVKSLPEFKAGRLENCDNDLLAERFDKAVSDFNYLQAAVPEVQDKELAAQLIKMQQISQNMLAYLQKNPAKLTLAQQFVDYYQDRAVVLMKKYFSLEETALQTPEVSTIKGRIKTTLYSFDEAYEEQFTKLLNDQLLDVDAELKVVRQMFDSDGIKCDDKSQTAAEQTAQARFDDDFRFEAADRQDNDYNKKETAKADDYQFPPFRMIKSLLHGKGKGSEGWRHKNRQCDIIPENESREVFKTKIIAGLLGVCLGWLGAHKFYLRKNFQGVFYILFFWTFLPGLIGFIEGVRYLFMRKDDFYLEYYKK